MDITYGRVGACDLIFPRWVRDVTNLQMMDARLPGRDLPDDDRAQFIEQELMQREAYRSICKQGYRRWFFEHLACVWKLKLPFPLSIPAIIPRFAGANRRAAVFRRHWAERGIPVNFDSAFYPPFDLFSLVRSMEAFAYDLYDCPDLLEAALQKSLPDALAQAKMLVKRNSGQRVAIYPMLSSASFISPRIFERFV